MKPDNVSLHSPVFVLLHPDDNVLIVRKPILAGEAHEVAGQSIVFSHDIDLGHKVACKPIPVGLPVFKYGVSIGSASGNIKVGDHVHLNNLRSDYIAIHTRAGRSDTETSND